MRTDDNQNAAMLPCPPLSGSIEDESTATANPKAIVFDVASIIVASRKFLAPSCHCVSASEFFVDCLAYCISSMLGYNYHANTQKSLQYCYKYPGTLLKHGHIPITDSNCERKQKPFWSPSPLDDDVESTSMILRSVGFLW